MLTVQPLEPELCANAGLTMREIHSSSATSTLVSRVLVASMLTAQPQDRGPCASAGVVTLATHSQSAGWSHAPLARVGPMLIAPLREGLLFASASQATQVTRTQTAYSTLALVVLVARGLSAIIMGGLLSANAPHNILEIPMLLADPTLAAGTHVALMLTVPAVEREPCVLAEEAILAAPTAGPGAGLTLA